MKLGLFGGSFDPIHLGHLLLAESAREACQLDQVWFIPAAQSPLKENIPQATGKQRLEMLRLAIAGYPTFVASDMEVKRKGTSFTIDTLKEISQARPADELYLIIGADSLADFPRWKDPEGILDLATVVAVNRGKSLPSLAPIEQQLGSDALPCFQLIDMPGVDLSATEIRQCTTTGRSIRFRTPRAVEQYIHQHQLYRGTEAS